MNNNMEGKSRKVYRIPVGHWSISRVIYLVGGLFVTVSAALALAVDVRWTYLTIFVGLMFVNFALSGYCPMAIILARLGFREK